MHSYKNNSETFTATNCWASEFVLFPGLYSYNTWHYTVFALLEYILFGQNCSFHQVVIQLVYEEMSPIVFLIPLLIYSSFSSALTVLFSSVIHTEPCNSASGMGCEDFSADTLILIVWRLQLRPSGVIQCLNGDSWSGVYVCWLGGRKVFLKACWFLI